MKSLEETIRELQKKNKNKPSPLSEQYRRGEGTVHFISSEVKQVSPRDFLLNQFKPTAKDF